MNKLLFFTNQKTFSIPTSVQPALCEKIKESDFLVTDASGTHRLIGLKYVPSLMDAPVITCVCMRHEMVLAKKLAFENNKSFFYNTEASAMLFKYQTGEFLRPEDFEPIAIMYTKILKKIAIDL